MYSASVFDSSIADACLNGCTSSQMVVTVRQSCKAFLKLVIKRSHSFWSILLIVPAVVFFGGLSLTFGLPEALLRPLCLRFGHLGAIAGWAKVNFSRWVLWSRGVRVLYSGPGLKDVSNQRGVIYVANHQSLLDIPALMKILPGHSSFVAKKELLSIPVFGWAAFCVGTIFIDRKKGAQNKNLDIIKRRLRNGMSIIFFPEGTRSETGELKEFKRGAFVFALESKVDIVPVTIANSGRIMPKKSLEIFSGPIQVHFDQAISTKNLHIEDRKELSERVRALIAKNLEVLQESRKNRAS